MDIQIRKITTLSVAVLLLSLMTACQRSNEPIVIKFSHVVAVDTPKGQAAEYFKKLAEERTKGRVTVKIFPNSTLYKDKEEMDALQLGSVQMLAPSLSKFGPLGISEFEAFDLPYIFDGYTSLRKVTDGPVGKNLLKKLENKGILGLAFWDNGFKVMSANRPLHNPADFRGLKMRTQASHTLEAQMRALGANPQVITFGETYRALRAGIVDGTENPPSNLYTQKMYEVQKHVTVSDHGYLGYAVIVNKKFWEGLPTDIRKTLEGAMRDATRYGNETSKRKNEEALAAVRKSGKTIVYTLTPEEKRTWKKALIGVHKAEEGRIGKDVIEAIYNATDSNPNKL